MIATLGLGEVWSAPRLSLRRSQWRLAVAALAVVAVLVAGSSVSMPTAAPTPRVGTAPQRAAWPEGLEQAARAALGAEAYAVARDGRSGTWRADNPAQSLAATFAPSGVTVTPAGPSGGERALDLRYTGAGRGTQLTAAPAATIVSAGARVEYRRGAIVEWYANDERGIEQGFTLAERPPGPGPLTVEMALSGGLQATLVGDGVDFAGPDDTPVLRYDGLVVRDAAGRELPAHMALAQENLQLVVDDRAATYPVVIDPVITNQQAKITSPTPTTNQWFGNAVAISGDTAVIGAPFEDGAAGANTGAAYVFVRSGVAWSFQNKLTAPDAAAGDEFGWSVAMSENTLIIGSPLDVVGAVTGAGSAYVFVRPVTSWNFQAKLTADVPADDNFGVSVAVSGDVAAVGAAWDDRPAGFASGAAYVFARAGTAWSQQARLLSAIPAESARFGESVAVAGETVLVGAPFEAAAAGEPRQGAVYVYVRSGVTWTQQARLLAADGVLSGQFGFSMSLSPPTVLIGAPGANGTGAAYVFVGSGSSWSQQAKLQASDAAVGDNYGAAVGLSGDTAVVGAPNDNTDFGSRTGSVYAYERAGTAWDGENKLMPDDPGANEQFGTSVAVSGATAVVGVPHDATTVGTDAGSAYVFVPDPILDVSDATVVEGDAGTTTLSFTVTRSDPRGTASVEAHTADGTATAPSDYGPIGKTLVFTSGQRSKAVSVVVNGDTQHEDDEALFLVLSNAAGANIDDGVGQGTITNDDAEPVPATLTVADVTVGEGDPAVFTITRSGSTLGTTTVEVSTEDGSASAPDDYDPVATTVSFGPGDSSATVTVQGADDTADEPDENFLLRLANVVGGVIGDGAAVGTLVDDDDPAATLAIDDHSVGEGDSGSVELTFTVTRSGSTTGTATVHYETADGTAVAPGDYVAAAGDLTFADGVATQTVSVDVVGDTADEADESFTVVLSAPTGAVLSDASGAGTIVDDDAPPPPTCDGQVATIVGTSGNDSLSGTAGPDVIVALGGNDTVNGGRGNDVVCGGPGTDKLRGQGGGDRLFGEAGADRLYGGGGNDALDGGTESDNCDGDAGTDTATSCESVVDVP
jgi:Ca2+-binding RTX toxin-like protein